MRCPRLSVDEKVLLLCSYCGEARPAHRFSVLVSDHSLCERHGRFVFKAGKILNGLIDHVVSGKGKFMSQTNRERLMALPWFPKWVRDVRNRRSSRLDVNSEVRMMVAEYKEKPQCGDLRTVILGDGVTHRLNGSKLLDKIASSWFGDETISNESKRLVEQSAWGMRWLHDKWKRMHTSKLRATAEMCKKREYDKIPNPCVHFFV